MKKTVPFKAFGQDDYLYFDIGKLVQLEQLTGKTVIELWDASNSGKFGVDLIVKCLTVGLIDCRQNITEKQVMAEMGDAFEKGESLVSFITPIFSALIESGIFGGKKATPARKNVKE